MILTIPTPRAFLPLLRPARFKGLRGGRGAAKSHFVAERIVEDCVCEHHRVACLREFQSSMRESVKQLLEDKIAALGVDHLFNSTDTEIRGPNDSLIVFKGLQGGPTQRAANALKSLEGFTRAWVEEAQSISQRSLAIMTPTFRRGQGMSADPEMYFSWNPIGKDDPVERLFREHDDDDPDFICVTATYRDNPWFPDDLRRDMERDRARDPDRYAHVWLGEYQRNSEARVFRNWRIAEFETPEDVRFYFGADWGFAIDPTVLVRCWLHGRTLYVDQEAHSVACEIDHTPALFDRVPGARKWPIRADSARPETISFMRRAGFSISPAVKGPNSVEDGIEFLKSHDIVVHPRCRHTIDELSRYAYKVDRRTDEVLPVLEDKNNHVIDALRYALEGARLGPSPMTIPAAALRRAKMSLPHRQASRL